MASPTLFSSPSRLVSAERARFLSRCSVAFRRKFPLFRVVSSPRDSFVLLLSRKFQSVRMKISCELLQLLLLRKKERERGKNPIKSAWFREVRNVVSIIIRFFRMNKTTGSRSFEIIQSYAEETVSLEISCRNLLFLSIQSIFLLLYFTAHICSAQIRELKIPRQRDNSMHPK